MSARVARLRDDGYSAQELAAALRDLLREVVKSDPQEPRYVVALSHAEAIAELLPVMSTDEEP